MIEINLFDTTFTGQPCSVATQTPRTMRYVRDQMKWDGVTVFTNDMMHSPIVDDVQSRYKVGWITGDARCHRPYYYDRIWEIVEKFTTVMTHDADLLHRGAHYLRQGAP